MKADNPILIVQVRQGDRKAFRRIYDHYREQVWCFASRYLQNPSDLEEIVQEIFVKVWETRERIDPHRSLSNYLFTITKNTIFNKRQKRINEQAYLRYMRIYQTASRLETEKEVFYTECRHMVEKSIQSLPAKRRQVYRLNREQGLSHKEISEKLGISQKTIESHMRLALIKIRSDLQDYL